MDGGRKKVDILIWTIHLRFLAILVVEPTHEKTTFWMVLEPCKIMEQTTNLNKQTYRKILFCWLVVEPTHLKKYARQSSSSPQVRVKINKYLKPPPSL